jgi:pimeloyl-ACP methyl ester carboxylesterase
MIPLVLLPGMMCDYRLFTPQINALGGRHSIILPPIGGHPSIAALAAEVLAHAPPRFALAGLSMGGIVAMEMLAQAPDRVDRLALLDTNPRAETPEAKARRAPQIAQVQAGKLVDVMRDEMKPNYLADGPDKAALLNLCLDMALALGPEVFVNQSLALRDRSDQQATLRAYPRPALVLCGAQDRLCPVERHAAMHALMPHSTLIIIPGAGHLPTLEQPLKTTAALIRWLEE